MLQPTRRLGPIEGTALYLGAVLGPGVMVLPSLAARAAGPASIIAWLTLLVLSVPVAATFAALGARHPDGGGVATFTARAFGPRAAVIVGYWFYLAVPVGVLAGAMVGGEYLAAALGLDRAAALTIAGALLAAAFAVNHAGLRLSGRIQLILAGMLVVLLLVTIVTAAPDGRAANFQPFAPYGWAAVGTAATVLFYAFSGWEAAIHLSGEFRDPRRHLPQVTAVTLAVVSVLYLGVALITIATLGRNAGATTVPLSLLMELVFGPTGRVLTTVAAVALSFVAINTYIAGGARLGAALGRDGALPRGLSRGTVPRRSLGVQAVMCAAALTAVALFSIELDTLMRVTTVFLAAVSCVGMAAALRLLRRGSILWYGAWCATVFTMVVLAFCGPLLVLPSAVGLCSLLVPRSRLNLLTRAPRELIDPRRTVGRAGTPQMDRRSSLDGAGSHLCARQRRP